MTLKPLSDMACGDFYSVSDLNGEQSFVQSGSFSAAGDGNVRWQAAVRTSHGLSSMEDFAIPQRKSPHCCRTICHGFESRYPRRAVTQEAQRIPVLPQDDRALTIMATPATRS